MCLVFEEVGSKMTCKLSVQVWRSDFWVGKNWKASNIHWPVVILMSIFTCALGRESCWRKSTATKQCSVLFSARALCIILHWSCFMRDLKWFKFCFLDSFLSPIYKSVRDVHPGKMLQEELVLELPKGWQIYLPLLFCDQKNPILFCTGTNPKCFTLFSPTRWNVNKMSLLAWKSWPFPFLLATARVHWSTELLLPTSSGTTTRGHAGSRRFSYACAVCPGSQWPLLW